MKNKRKSTPIRFGTFYGVFTAGFLTISGLIMYLFGPWAIERVGELGAILIITLSTILLIQLFKFKIISF